MQGASDPPGLATEPPCRGNVREWGPSLDKRVVRPQLQLRNRGHIQAKPLSVPGTKPKAAPPQTAGPPPPRPAPSSAAVKGDMRPDENRVHLVEREQQAEVLGSPDAAQVPLTHPCPAPGGEGTASCTLHSHDLKALSQLPTPSGGQASKPARRSRGLGLHLSSLCGALKLQTEVIVVLAQPCTEGES